MGYVADRQAKREIAKEDRQTQLTLLGDGNVFYLSLSISWFAKPNHSKNSYM